VLSLGGGWQSSAALLMSCAGELPKLDAAVFADTQNEMPETYDYLDYLGSRAEQAGIKLIRATSGNLRTDVYDKAGKGMQPSLPVRVRDENGDLQRVNGYTCSFDYKRRVVTREVRRLCGSRGDWKRSSVEQWIGYPWRLNAWPLITELRMTRNDTRRWIIENGHPEPPRSACFFCPNRGNSHWRYLRTNGPTCGPSPSSSTSSSGHG
jgi:hypothetical protein